MPPRKRIPSHKNQGELVLVTPRIEIKLEAIKQHVLFLSKKAKLSQEVHLPTSVCTPFIRGQSVVRARQCGRNHCPSEIRHTKLLAKGLNENCLLTIYALET